MFLISIHSSVFIRKISLDQRSVLVENGTKVRPTDHSISYHAT